MTVTVKAYSVSSIMKSSSWTFLMRNHISFEFCLSCCSRGTETLYPFGYIKCAWKQRVWREGRNPGLYIRRVCCTLLEDGAAWAGSLGAKLQRKSAIPLEQKTNNTTDGCDNYAILPDLGYDITITQSW